MMERYRSAGLDAFFVCFVLIHVIGSAILAFLVNLPLGILLFNSAIWLYAAFVNRHKKAGILLSGLGWSLTLFLLTRMPSSYSASLAMNLILVIFILYLHYDQLSLVIQGNHIEGINGMDLGCILLLTGLFLIIGEYINAVSMIFFHNYVTESLGTIRLNLAYGILVFALAPALVEEILFRGYVFQKLGNGRKAILVSALLFALGHMNINQMTYAFVIGLLFAIVFSVTGNLTYTLGIHFLFNLYSLLMMAYEESRLAGFISGIQIGGYHLFSPSLADSAGNPEKGLILTGFLILLATLVIVALLLYSLSGRKHVEKRDGAQEGWKPGIAFYLATAVCLVIAILYELM